MAQKDLPWTLPLGVLFFLFAGLLLYLDKSTAKSPSLWTSGKEFAVLLSILLLAIGLRVYRLDLFPAGFTTDEGFMGLTVQRIIHEHYRPFTETFDWLIGQPDMYYALAAWFHFVPVSQVSFFLYSVTVSLLAMPFLYFTYRSLTDTSTALTALFFLYVSRWFLTYSRDGHPAIGVPLIIGFALTFWLYGVQKEKTWAFVLCGAGLAAGLYDYQELKFLPLLILIYGAYESWRGEKRTRLLKNGLFLGITFVLLSLPVLEYLWQVRGLTPRERYLFAFPDLFLEKGMVGVWDHWWESFGVLNRQGDLWGFNNIPHHRHLDDITGALWILGLFTAFFHLKEPRYFYPVAGFFVFLLPDFLSSDSFQTSRMLGTLPFVCLLAAETSVSLLQKARTLDRTKFSTIVFSFLLIGCAAQNAWDYFGVQAKDPQSWRVLGAAESTWVARSVRRYAPACTCLLCSKFYMNYQIWFLDHDLIPQMREWKLPGSLDFPGADPQKGVCLFFEEGQWGVLKLFQTRYPGGNTEIFRDLNGEPIAALYAIPLPIWLSRVARYHSRPQGLKAFYYRSTDEKGVPWVTRVDPLLNFTFHDDFPFTDFPPLSVRWSGLLNLPKAGIYEWTILTNDHIQMNLDHLPILTDSRRTRRLFLKKGRHPIEIHFKKTEGVDTALTLLWKIPGDDRFETVPASVLEPGP